MKIVKVSHGGAVTIRMSGDFHREHIAELKTQLEERRPRMILDLKDVTLVDVDVVRFLAGKTARRDRPRCCRKGPTLNATGRTRIAPAAPANSWPHFR